MKKMSEYGKGYILKGALLDAVDWDNDIEKWTIRDDDLESLMAQKNDAVQVVRCKDCEHFYPFVNNPKFGECMVYVCDLEDPAIMEETGFCSDGERRS